MRDWNALVEQHLAGLALEPKEKAEVITELAAHLEDLCEEMRGKGIAEEEAVRRALSRAGDWRDLQRKIFDARRREHFMATRFRQLWFPGFLTLILSMALLALLQKAGFQARIFGGGPNPLLMYMPWFLSLPFCGALGAFLSSRAGGSQRTAVLASVFPALALTLAFLLMVPIGLAVEAIIGRHDPFQILGQVRAFGPVAGVLLRDAIGWILIPACALLLGGLLANFLLSARSSSRSVAIV
jgi:hypothetical protein